MIEVEIHDGPYNNIKNWDYAGLIQAFTAEDGRNRGIRAGSGVVTVKPRLDQRLAPPPLLAMI